MKLYLLVGTAFMLAMSTCAHAGPTPTQDGPSSMTKPNGDAGITAPMQERPVSASEGNKPSSTQPAMTKPSTSAPGVVTKP
jgi:hypothetical protein